MAEKDTSAPPPPVGRRTHQAVSQPSRSKGSIGSWNRGLLRSSPLLDGVYARLVHIGAAFRPTIVPLQRGEGFRPIFIVGAGRSGNTLLRRILAAGDEVHIPPETYVLGTAISLFRRTQHLGWRQQVSLTLAQFEFHPEFEDFGVQLRELAEEVWALAPGRRSLAAVIDSFYRFHRNSIGSIASRWGDKTPLNVYSMDRIHSVFPDSVFLHMVRDGVDVAASYMRSGLMNSFEDAAQRWRTSLEAVEAFNRRHPEQCLEVRYESLVADPATEARRAASFAGLKFAPEMIDELSHVNQLGDVTTRAYHGDVRGPVHAKSVGAGRRDISPADRAVLDRVIGPTLERWNYPPAA